MKHLFSIALILALAHPVFADDLEALEQLKQEMKDTQLGVGIGLTILGAVTAVYGGLQWKDARDAENALEDAGWDLKVNRGRYMALVGGGVLATIVGIWSLDRGGIRFGGAPSSHADEGSEQAKAQPND